MGKRVKAGMRAMRRRRVQSKELVALLFALGVVAAVVISFVRFGSNGAIDSRIEPVSDSGWSRGSAAGQVVLVEYSDFQCPACAAYYPALQQLYNEFGGDVRFVYRHYPILQIHPNAELAARAAEAAGMQGKFWEMHDKLFEGQQLWAEMSASDAASVFLDFAREIGLDADQFQADMYSAEAAERVEADYRSGTAAGVVGTPTFFLNGRRIRGTSPDGLRSILINAIREARNS